MHTGDTRLTRRARPRRYPNSHLLIDTEKRTLARGSLEKTGGRLAAAPSRVQSGLAARLPAKSTSGRRRAGGLRHTHQSRGMSRLTGRAAFTFPFCHPHNMYAQHRSVSDLRTQRGSLPPLSRIQLFSLSETDLRGNRFWVTCSKHAQSEYHGSSRHALPSRGQ